MKLRYTISSICATLALFLLGSTNAKALSYWTQQYDGLPALYDITGIIGYGNNMILGSQPYYTPTSSVSFTASTDGHKVYRFVKDGNIIFGVGDSAILKSMDDGQTWTPTAMSYPIYHIGLNARLYCNGGTVYTWDPFNANFGFDIMKSTDTGNTWQPTGIQKPDGYAFLMHDGVIYSSSLTGLQYSTTNGNSWLYITTIGSTINDIVAFNDSIFVATNTGVYKSSDKGQTWSATLPYNALCLHVAGGSLLCGTQAKGVWQSDPSGNIWFSKSVDLPFMASGDYKPVTSISMNDIYIMANVLYDTTAGPITFHTLYTMPVTELKAEHIAAVINDIQVYPNPATNEIFIDTDHLQGQNIRIALSDMQGSRILNRDYALQPTISLKLENIPQGTYILNISTGYNSISKKITITH